MCSGEYLSIRLCGWSGRQENRLGSFRIVSNPNIIDIFRCPWIPSMSFYTRNVLQQVEQQYDIWDQSFRKRRRWVWYVCIDLVGNFRLDCGNRCLCLRQYGSKLVDRLFLSFYQSRRIRSRRIGLLIRASNMRSRASSLARRTAARVEGGWSGVCGLEACRMRCCLLHWRCPHRS